MTYIEWVSKVWGAFRKHWFYDQAYDRRWGIDAYHLARALSYDMYTKEYQQIVKATSAALADLSHPKMGLLKSGSEGPHLAYLLESDAGLLLRPDARSFPNEISEQELVLLQALAVRSEEAGANYATLKDCTLSALYRELGRPWSQTTRKEAEVILGSLSAAGLVNCRAMTGDFKCRPTFDGMVLAQRWAGPQGTV